MAATLSDDERERARRYVSASVRNRFIAARGTLRTVLGWYLGCDPRTIQFRYSATGRPELASLQNDGALSFNVSHSGDLTLIAISRGRRIGIDLERIRPIPEVEAIVLGFFTSTEQAEWRSLPEEQRLRAFYSGWTRKEAVLKAIGVGLSTSSGRVEVSLAELEHAGLRHIEFEGERASDWRFVSLPPINGYVSALVVEITVSENDDRQECVGQTCGTLTDSALPRSGAPAVGMTEYLAHAIVDPHSLVAQAVVPRTQM